MITDQKTRDDAFRTPYTATALWVALVAALSIGGSFALACAVPFAAIAALAAITMDRGNGLTLVIVAWLSNQAIGYGFLDYPQDANSFAWGGALGLSAVAGFVAARAVSSVKASQFLSIAVAFTAAFVAYEASIYAAGLVLGGTEGAFSVEAVTYILMINAAAFAGLVVLHRGAIALHVLRPAGRAPEPAAA